MAAFYRSRVPAAREDPIRDTLLSMSDAPPVPSAANAPSAPSQWDPAQYERFKSERSRPFFDLLALVRPRTGMRVVDLGCGTGELTGELHARLGAKETLGIDSSETMLAKAAEVAMRAGGGLKFERGGIEAWARGSSELGKSDAKLDLVFSNAALHWVDGHEDLLARMKSVLAPGGQIALQMPANDDHASHLVAAEVAREAPFREKEALDGFVRKSSNLALERYAELLHGLGFEQQIVRMQVYGHLLDSRDGVVEWVKGTLLTDYARRMSAEMYERFLARYREVLFARLEDAKPFFFTFKRMLIWGALG
jgi:trans-aconitate 2-methyltransferase